MAREVFPEEKVHPAIREKIERNHHDLVEEVKRVVAENDVVVVGMAMNSHARDARRLLEERRIPFRYLEYGGYLGRWRRRNVLKMWTGWPTFPMVFVKGILIGGATDLAALAESGELDEMLGKTKS
jgi:monothiol glutaredoxin